MGKRGPAPKPAELKLLDGNPGKREASDTPMSLPVRDPDPPSWLDREACAEWRRVCRALGPARLLTAADRATLAAYCRTWSLFHRASKEIDRHGLLDVGSQGQTVIHPAHRVLAESRAALLQFAQQFGLTPAARARLVRPQESTEDQLMLFLTGTDD